MSRLSCLVLAVGGLWAPGVGLAQGYGHLTGQFVLEGTKPKVVVPNLMGQNAQQCAVNPPLPENTLIVDEETKGIANVVVHLKEAPRRIHPDLKASKEKTVSFDQKDCRFFPHVLLVRTDQTVMVKNSDGFNHNTHTFPFANDGLNFLIQANDQKGVPVSYKKPEKLPTTIKCDLHPHMKAHWLILDHPYMAKTDEKGKFQIENLPAGRYTFTVWHERIGYIDREMKVAIKTNATEDLGQVQVPAAKIKTD